MLSITHGKATAKRSLTEGVTGIVYREQPSYGWLRGRLFHVSEIGPNNSIGIIGDHIWNVLAPKITYRGNAGKGDEKYCQIIRWACIAVTPLWRISYKLALLYPSYPKRLSHV